MTMERSCLGVIPARAASTRFPNKIVAGILGKPMIQHVWEAAGRASRLNDVIVATDDPQIASAVTAFGGKAVLTGECQSGTDRVAEVALTRFESIVVNLQGDEPLLPPGAIDGLVEAMEAHPECGMATLAVRCQPGPGLEDPNVVKVVVSRQGEALFFSRRPLVASPDGSFWKHVGIYAFRRDVLLKFREWGPSPLELAERLEQLRALDHGIRIRVVPMEVDTIAVDVPDDIRKVEERLRS